MTEGKQEVVKVNEKSNRAWRRTVAFQKRSKQLKKYGVSKPSRVMERGVQDSSDTQFATYNFQEVRRSRNGVEHIHFRTIVDVIGLEEKKDEDIKK